MKTKRNKGFTLIEIMVAMAIVALLAGAVLVSMAGYGKDARASKALTQLSSAIVSMQSCWTFGGKAYTPSIQGGNAICTLGATYGNWPASDAGYQYAAGSVPCSGTRGSPDCVNSTQWWIYIRSVGDDRKVCCNIAAKGCASSVKSAADACNQAGWTN